MGSDDDAVPEITYQVRFKVFVSRLGGCLSIRNNEATRGIRAVVSGDRIDHVEVREGGGSVKSDQVPRGKLWRVIKNVFACFGQAGDDIALEMM